MEYYTAAYGYTKVEFCSVGMSCSFEVSRAIDQKVVPQL